MGRETSALPKQARETMRTAAIAAAVVLLAASMWPRHSLAQSAPAAKQMQKTGDVILLLGTHGGPGLEKARSETSVVLIVDGRPYLIDAGIGTMRRLLEAGVPSATIGTIFITHDHPDHTLGLVGVLGNDFLGVDFGRRAGLKKFEIYGPPPTAELVSAAYNFIRIAYGTFAAESLGASTLVDPFEVHEIAHNGPFYHDDKIRVAAAENTHFQLMPAKYRAHMKSYAYRFDTPHGAIVFTGDTGPSEAVQRLANGADVLVSEIADLGGPTNAPSQQPSMARGASARPSILADHMRMEHLSAKDVGEMASKAHVKAVLLYHLVATNPQALAEGVKRYFSGPVYAGEDLARYCLGTADSNRTNAQVLHPCQ